MSAPHQSDSIVHEHYFDELDLEGLLEVLNHASPKAEEGKLQREFLQSELQNVPEALTHYHDIIMGIMENVDYSKVPPTEDPKFGIDSITPDNLLSIPTISETIARACSYTEDKREQSECVSRVLLHLLATIPFEHHLHHDGDTPTYITILQEAFNTLPQEGTRPNDVRTIFRLYVTEVLFRKHALSSQKDETAAA